MTDSLHDTLIIGAGPAGLTAGLYAGRAGLKVLILERSFPGGQATKTDVIENYPGFPEGITGIDLTQLMEKQTIRFGAEIAIRDVSRLTIAGDSIKVTTASGELSARSVIIATGSEPRRLGVRGEDLLYGRGVSTCAVCDGPLYRDRAVAVVGGGDSALTGALFLARLCTRVYLVHRRGSFRAAKIVQDRVRSTPNIEIVSNSVVQEVLGANRVEGIETLDKTTHACRRFSVAGLFVYVGEVPNTQFVREVVKLDAHGHILTDENMATSCPIIFAAGDCRHKELRQISTAVGDGALAAASVERLLLLHQEAAS